MFSATIDVYFFRKLNNFILNEGQIIMALSPSQRELFPNLEKQISEAVKRAWLAMVEQGSTRATIDVEEAVLQGVEAITQSDENRELIVRLAHVTIYSEIRAVFGINLEQIELIFPTGEAAAIEQIASLQTQYTLIGSGIFSKADIEHQLDRHISEQSYIRIKQIAFECDNSDYLENILSMTEVGEVLEAEAESRSIPETKAN